MELTQKGNSAQQTPSIQSLDRGLTILEAVANREGPVSLSELTDLLEIDRSSVFRLASTLKRRGFLAYPTGRKEYVLGPSLWRLSHKYNWGKMLIRISHMHLKALAAETNETAQLAIRDDKQAVFIDSVTATNQILCISGRIGETTPLYCTAHGKALIAGLTTAELRQLLGPEPLHQHTRRTAKSIKELAKVGTALKEHGFVTDDEEYHQGVRCVAAPIVSNDGQILGSIGISAPSTRFPVQRFQECGEEVRRIAGEISKLLNEAPED